MITVLLSLILVVNAFGVCGLIYSHKKRRAQNEARERQRKNDEQHRRAEEEAWRTAVEHRWQKLEAEYRLLEQEDLKIRKELDKSEEERKRLNEGLHLRSEESQATREELRRINEELQNKFKEEQGYRAKGDAWRTAEEERWQKLEASYCQLEQVELKIREELRKAEEERKRIEEELHLKGEWLQKDQKEIEHIKEEAKSKAEEDRRYRAEERIWRTTEEQKRGQLEAAYCQLEQEGLKTVDKLQKAEVELEYIKEWIKNKIEEERCFRAEVESWWTVEEQRWQELEALYRQMKQDGLETREKLHEVEVEHTRLEGELHHRTEKLQENQEELRQIKEVIQAKAEEEQHRSAEEESRRLTVEMRLQKLEIAYKQVEKEELEILEELYKTGEKCNHLEEELFFKSEELKESQEALSRLQGKMEIRIEEEQHRRAKVESERAAEEQRWSEREKELYRFREECKHLEGELHRSEKLQLDKEELRQSEEEVQIKAGKELYHDIKQESVQKIFVEEASKTDENKDCFSEEEPQCKGEVTYQVNGRNYSPSEAESKRMAPCMRGGRPRGTEQNPSYIDEQPQSITKLHSQKAEIVCCNRERQWILGIEIPEQFLESSDLELFQDTLPLKQDESNEALWLLKQLHGQVVVRWREDQDAKEDKILLGEENYLLFKLYGHNQSYGYRVNTLSSGSYLVIFPEIWKYNEDETVLNLSRSIPELTFLHGYQAHYLTLEKGEQANIVFYTPEKRQVVIKTRVSKFELVGNRLNDASGIGPLFCEVPPKICALDGKLWEDIGTFVIGEEGEGRKRWRKSFSPNLEKKEQDLPSDVVARGSGWYFLRIYNRNDDLLESLDFRFISALKAIEQEKPFPPPIPLPHEGHRPVHFTFSHDSGCIIKPVNDAASIVQVEYQDNKSVLTIPSDPNCDETRWLICPKSEPQMEVTIVVERVWWALGEENEEPSQWVDRPIHLSYIDLSATSSKAMWLRFPKPRWAEALSIGFTQSRAKDFRIKAISRTVSIPLRNFGDAQEVQDIGEPSLNFWIRKFYTATICKVTIKAVCKFCDLLLDREENAHSHIISSHFQECRSEFFSELTYEELRGRDPSLPAEIYKCSYCSKFRTRNSSESIGTHIERKHKGMPKAFTLIKNVDEIRANVIKNLPHIYKCNLCSTQFPEKDQNKMMLQHLLEKHKNDLYKLL